jgi:ferrochelatase
MRYWHPFAGTVAQDVADWVPDRVILLPLYPQFSTTTTESFSRVWYAASRNAGLTAPTSEVCCWPEVPGFIETVARMTDAAIDNISGAKQYRVLFSAHGLPQKIVDGGDPYAHQVERTTAAILDKMTHKEIDSLVCYQSRVGPLEWLRPYTEDEIKKAGMEKRALVVVPVAFVSEHSETLVELDIEYAELAKKSEVPEYLRVPTARTADAFIQSIAGLVKTAPDTGTVSGGRVCAAGFGNCPCQQKAA